MNTKYFKLNKKAISRKLIYNFESQHPKLNPLKTCTLFVLFSLFMACSSGMQISEQLKKSISQNNIEQVAIEINGLSNKHRIDDLKIGEQFIILADTYYNLSAVKLMRIEGKELKIMM